MSHTLNAYIVEPVNQGWIIERLMRDIAAELNRRGIPTRIGPASGYGGESVIFNSRFLTPLHDGRARLNSLFITHVDDRIKERELTTSFDRFNSLVCISAQDADFVAALRGRRDGVAGIELPARDLIVRPLRVALFSAYYDDGRKNEAWIPAYFEARPQEVRQAFVFCFLGSEWESFAGRMAALDLNYEVVRYARSLPREYEQYKERLATMDALVYPGFDGGAMSVYDGLAAGLEVLASDVSYHRGLGSPVTLFADRDGFFQALDGLYDRWHSRSAALEARSLAAYVDRLLSHWHGLLGGTDAQAIAAPPAAAARPEETLALFRSHYKPLSFSRLRSALIRAIQARVLK
jgi:hypothetical protein